jgi:hypothetical protein
MKNAWSERRITQKIAKIAKDGICAGRARAGSHLNFAAFWADFLWTAVRESRLAAQNELFVRRKVIFQQRQPPQII